MCGRVRVGRSVIKSVQPARLSAAKQRTTERADCSSDAECTGLLPWATLGLERLDPWGKVIRYSASKELAKAGAVLTIGGSTSSATKQIYSSSRLTTTSGDVAVSVAVVAWSQGARNFGTSEAGTALPNGSTTNVDEQANDQGTAAGRPAGTGFVSRTPTSATDARDKAGNPVGEFDDVVTWIPVGTLVARMVQAGRLP